MQNNVTVTVLITAYNEEEKIVRCLDSVEHQTFDDFEIVLINDGSTDNTDKIIQQYIVNEDDKKKIRYISRENKGRIASLNEGILLARGKYIAIQDADDYSMKDRLKKQVEFLETHQNVDVVGTAYVRLDSIRGERYIRRYPTEDCQIKREMCKYIPLCQGSMMIKAEVIRSVNGYNPQCKDAEDLDLWVRLGNRITMANIDEPLYVYDLTMQNSYFHKNYRIGDRNIRVFQLNCKAVKVFHLPMHYYIYPCARLLYPYIPTWMKRIARWRISKIKEEPYVTNQN